MVASDWISWLFLLDDQLDEGTLGRDPVAARAFLRPLAELLDENLSIRLPGEGPFRAVLRDVWSRIVPVTSPTWHARFKRHMADYLDGCVWEAVNRASGRVPGSAEFPAYRRRAGAIWPSLDLLEFVARAPLPDSVYSRPLFVELRRAAADVVCWTDDVLTVDKERARGDVHNLVIVLQHSTGCTAGDAMARAAYAIDSRLADFLECERRLPDLLGPREPEATLGSAGVFGFVPLPEIVHQQEALEREMADPAVIAFIESAGLLIKWINDLSSYAKDMLDGSKDQVTNPITVLGKHLRCAPQQAVVELISLWNRTMLLVVVLRERLLRHASPGLAHILTDTANGLANILNWHDDNPRYAMIARAFSVTDQPTADLDLTPPAIPSIAWWWTHIR
jgi:hypothetical protein